MKKQIIITLTLLLTTAGASLVISQEEDRQPIFRNDSTGLVPADVFPNNFRPFGVAGFTTSPDQAPADSSLVRDGQDLQGKVQQLLERYRKAPAEDRKLLTEQLHSVLAEQFKVRQDLREAEIVRLEAEVKRLRELHAKRNEQSAQIVANRVSELLRDAEGLGWGSENRFHTAFPNDVLRSNIGEMFSVPR